MVTHSPAVFTNEAWSWGEIAYSLHFLKMCKDWIVIMPIRMWCGIRKCRLNTQSHHKRGRHKQRREKGLNPTNVISVELMWTQIYETKSHNITVVTINVQSLKPKHLDITQYWCRSVYCHRDMVTRYYFS